MVTIVLGALAVSKTANWLLENFVLPLKGLDDSVAVHSVVLTSKEAARVAASSAGPIFAAGRRRHAALKREGVVA